MELISGCGGLILCGGRSSRMGADKAYLPFGEGTMLSCVVETLRKVVSPVCVIASPGQNLPNLPADVLVGEDDESERGPIAGLLTGLKHLAPHSDRIFCSSCDSPLLMPDVVRLINDRLEDAEIAAPFDGKHWSPLCAVYRVHLVTRIEQNRSTINSPSTLIRQSRSKPISLSEIEKLDPEFHSLWNLNTPEEYRRGLEALKNR